MAPPRVPASPQNWTAIAIALVFFLVLQAGAIATYAHFVFDARYTCDRARDSCEVEHVRPFWREVTEQFRPSQLVKASWVARSRDSWVALEMASGAPEIRIQTHVSEELAARLHDFIADPAQPRFHHVVEPYVFHYLLSGLLQLLALIPLFGASLEVIQKLRARKPSMPPCSGADRVARRSPRRRE